MLSDAGKQGERGGERDNLEISSKSLKFRTIKAFRLAARVLLYAPSHRQNRPHTGRAALAGTRNSSMGPP